MDESGNGETEATQDPLDVYRRLVKAKPEDKAEIVLQLIEEHPQHRLELPERDGVRADLSGIDLSPEALRSRLDPTKPTPPWWDDFRKKANLSGARLQGASLSGAVLSDTNWSGWKCKVLGCWGLTFGEPI